MTTRRLGTETAKTRFALLDAAETLMRESGYAAVTSRRLAAQAGVKPQLVHYYFRTMDDLFIALFRRIADAIFARQAEALADPRPLGVLWELMSDPADVVLHHEFIALANHRKPLRTEIAAFGQQYRANQQAILAQAVPASSPVPPAALAVIGELVARGLVLERALGMDAGHAETRAAVQALLDALDAAPR
ncbi:MAG: TetR/AcrR family transcriptional regulator [Sphingomonadales bacterium]|nr:TetR/AcrR family transcriptional regulator [Sphingomonadales bacterium]